MKKKAKELLKSVNEQAALRIAPNDPDPLRKGEFEVNGGANHPANAKPELLHKADDIYITSKISGKHPTELKLWKQYEPQMSELRKAGMDSGSGTGAEWIPTDLSTEIIRQIELRLKVADIFPRMTMPTPTWEIPAKRSRSEARLFAESGGTDAQSFTTAKISLTAVTLMTYLPLDYEMEEDAIIPMLPEIKNDIAEGFAVAQEKAVLDGDTAGTHQDADVTNAYDARKAWDGLRKLCPASSMIDMGATVLTATKARSIPLNMGVYGKDVSGVVWIASLDVYHQLRNLGEVITLDKYGPNATILKGELGKFDGSPLIVSEYVRTDLDASGFNQGSYVADVKSILICVRKDGFFFGDRRKLMLETDKDIVNQYTMCVGSSRMVFKARYATTETVVGIGYNIKTGSLS